MFPISSFRKRFIFPNIPYIYSERKIKSILFSKTIYFLKPFHISLRTSFDTHNEKFRILVSGYSSNQATCLTVSDLRMLQNLEFRGVALARNRLFSCTLFLYAKSLHHSPGVHSYQMFLDECDVFREVVFSFRVSYFAVCIDLFASETKCK